MVRIVFASLAPAALAEFVRLPMEIKMKEKRRAEGTSRLTKHFATYRYLLFQNLCEFRETPCFFINFRSVSFASFRFHFCQNNSRTLYALRQQSDIESESAFNATAETEYPVNVPLQSYHELAYTGPFSVGDGSKFVTIQNMVYDTGSELCWSFSANEGVQCCRNAVCDPVGKKLINCNPDSKWQNAMRLFGGQDPSCQSSETLLKLPLGQKTDPFVVCYGRGFARGTFTNSTVRFHPAQKAIQHPFGIATTASDLEQDFGGCSGLLGLGPKNSERNPSIIYRMYSQGVIDEPMFSFSLGGNRGPEFILGGVDTSLVGPHNEMRWFPIKRQRLYSLWWTVDATFHTNEHSYSTPLVLDSGTTAVMIAKSHFDKFVRNVAADFGFRHNDPFLIGHADGHIDFKHCEDPLIKSKRMYGGHALKIRIGDSEYTLHPKDYIVELKDHSKGCFFGVSYLSDQDDVAILGDVFMKKYYTAFHFNKFDKIPST